MKLTFLGTGTSTGTPVIGCECITCCSSNPKDKRLRSSVIIEKENTQILIDAGPDLRQQLLLKKIKRLDGIVLTHGHYDHLGGLDDVRPLGASTVYGENNVLNTIKRTMPYCFDEEKYPGVPNIELVEIAEKPFQIGSIQIEPIRVMHGELPILGFRFGKLAYLTDVKTIQNSSIERLKGLEILVLNALRPMPHISHLSLSEAIALAQLIGAKKTYFTHFNHDIGLHNSTNSTLPNGIEMAFDGLELNVE